MIKEYFHIAHLISRHLSGEVTPEESRFLDKWRKESKSHALNPDDPGQSE